MCEQASRQSLLFYILSDTNKADAWLREREQLSISLLTVTNFSLALFLFFSVAFDNGERKAGNIVGMGNSTSAMITSAWLCLDADSLMGAEWSWFHSLNSPRWKCGLPALVLDSKPYRTINSRRYLYSRKFSNFANHCFWSYLDASEIGCVATVVQSNFVGTQRNAHHPNARHFAKTLWFSLFRRGKVRAFGGQRSLSSWTLWSAGVGWFGGRAGVWWVSIFW